MSLNVIAESLSRVTVLLSGLITSALLFQATEQSWSLADYGYLKTLMYWDSILNVFIMVGLGTAVVKSVSDSIQRPQSVGAAITMSLVAVTATTLAVSLLTVPLAELTGFLSLPSQPPEITAQLRALWILVVISILPGAYMTIAMSTFTGLQRTKRSLAANTVYNAGRVILILILFVYGMITITFVLYVYVLTAVLGFAVAALMLRQDLRQAGISLTLHGWGSVSGPLIRLSSVLFVLATLSLFGNFVSPLLVGVIGTVEELAVYDVGYRTMTTIKQFVYAPLAILLPNLSSMYSRGEHSQMKERFNESIRIIVPFLVFAVLVCFFFGEAILTSVYGARADVTVNGMSPVSFFVLMAPAFLLGTVSGLYNTVLNAATRLKPLFIIGLTTTVMQIVWVALMTPYLGVVAIALLWVALIPAILMSHLYSVRDTGLSIPRVFLLRLALLSLLLVPLTWLTSLAASYAVSSVSWLPFLSVNRLAALCNLAFAVPLWYAFIALCLLTGAMTGADLDNLRKFLKRIPPAWWISKPLLGFIEKTMARTVENPSTEH